MNTLYYGDNLGILQEHIKDESVDLIYLDPPFNSNANYNVLFKSPTGHKSHAQIEAFEDTWHWETGEAEQAFDEVMKSGNTDAAELLRAMRSFLKENDMMAYLTMMAVRLLELHRVLKETGSLYLHCDPTASHYLKLLMDSVFGVKFYRNEIIWQRTNAHNMNTPIWQRSSDTLLFYTKSGRFTFNPEYQAYGEAQLSRFRPDKDGRLFKAENLTFSTVRRHREFVWRGVKPPPHRSWGADLEQLEKWYAEGRILLKADGTPRLDGLKVYLDELPGKKIGNVWTDIVRISNTGGERLPYPTQKPVALLERVLNASSNEGDLVLDPFCGCGTAVHAAQKLGRQWIGIDITSLAIGLIEDRIQRAFPDAKFEVHGTPKDMDGARALAAKDKYQFQWWATRLIPGGVPYGGKKKGADSGIDGLFYFKPDTKSTEKGIISVKGGDNVSVAMVRDIAHVVKREKAQMGIFVTLTEATKPMLSEAVKEGFYDTAFGRFQRLQIIAVDRLLRGEVPRLPPTDESSIRRAQKEDTSKQEGLPF